MSAALSAEEFITKAPVHASNALVCPHCGQPTDVKDSRPVIVDGFATTKRRRHCCACVHRFNTIEINLNEYEKLVTLPAQFATFKSELEEVIGHADRLFDRVSRIEG